MGARPTVACWLTACPITACSITACSINDGLVAHVPVSPIFIVCAAVGSLHLDSRDGSSGSCFSRRTGRVDLRRSAVRLATAGVYYFDPSSSFACCATPLRHHRAGRTLVSGANSSSGATRAYRAGAYTWWPNLCCGGEWAIGFPGHRTAVCRSCRASRARFERAACSAGRDPVYVIRTAVNPPQSWVRAPRIELTIGARIHDGQIIACGPIAYGSNGLVKLLPGRRRLDWRPLYGPSGG